MPCVSEAQLQALWDYQEGLQALGAHPVLPGSLALRSFLTLNLLFCKTAALVPTSWS